MQKTSVESSNLSSIGWDNETLYVWFKNGKIYAYEGVPFEIYSEMVESASVGKFLNAKIKGVYPYQEVTELNLSFSRQ